MADNKDKKVLNVPAKRNVPVLRFPGFTEEWEKCSLSDIGLGFDYGMNAAAKAYDGENKYIRITDIDESSSLYNAKEIVSPDGDLSENYLVNDNDILLARTGASTGKSYLYTRSDGKLYFAGFLIRCNIPTHNPYFIFSQLHTRRFWKWVSIMSARSGQPGINSQEYASFPLYVCSKAEENKVASLLKMIDKRIELQNKIIEKLETLIKGIRNNIIFKINGDYIALQDIADIYQPQTIASTDLTEDGYLVYGANGVIGKYHSYNHEKEQICITCRGNTCGTVNFTKPKSWITGNAMVINTDSFTENVNKRYLFHYLSSINFNSIISGSGQPQIVRQPLAKLKLVLPSLVIQNHIAECLDTIATKIKNEQSFLQALQIQKTYLLSQMFI